MSIKKDLINDQLIIDKNVSETSYFVTYMIIKQTALNRQ